MKKHKPEQLDSVQPACLCSILACRILCVHHRRCLHRRCLDCPTSCLDYQVVTMDHFLAVVVNLVAWYLNSLCTLVVVVGLAACIVLVALLNA